METTLRDEKIALLRARGDSYEKIGNEVNLSGERVRQICEKDESIKLKIKNIVEKLVEHLPTVEKNYGILLKIEDESPYLDKTLALQASRDMLKVFKILNESSNSPVNEMYNDNRVVVYNIVNIIKDKFLEQIQAVPDIEVDYSEVTRLE